MDKIEIYSHPSCGYCHQAKGLLKASDIEFQELDIKQDSQLAIGVVNRTGGRTLPQIIINDQGIGGIDKLRRLDQSGDLNNLIHH